MNAQRLPNRLTIAVDTEFQGPRTLTVQAAARIDPNTLAVQLYQSPLLPEFETDALTNHPALQVFHDRHPCDEILVRPVRMLTADLSPATMAGDLFGMDTINIIPLDGGQARIDRFANRPGPGLLPVPEGVVWGSNKKRWKIPHIDLTLVGHFWRADFARVFGRDFMTSLKTRGADRKARLAIECRKLHRFVGTGGRSDCNPILEYMSHGQDLIAVRVTIRDTYLPYGGMSLDHLAKTFLNLPKSDVLDAEAKKQMQRTFLVQPVDAFAYAAADAITTLLVYEQMEATDRTVYCKLGIPDEETYTFRPTGGARVASVLEATTRNSVASGSVELATRTSLRELMHRGGIRLFETESNASKFGAGTGVVHGGLLLSRSPTKLWHESPGMLADVDMSSCYSAITSRMHVYWGRPVILEPGTQTMKLREAIELAQRICDPDGWMIRVTGSITEYPNALIPSTEGALTLDNYVNVRKRQRRRAATCQAVTRQAAEDALGRHQAAARLYAARIESGVVCAATWSVIRALPLPLRQQYENLTVDSTVMYPRALAARNGQEYDELVQRYRTGRPGWDQTLDEVSWAVVQRERLDESYVTLQYPLNRYAAKFAELRQQARTQHGKGSAVETAFKFLANSTYGVLACSFYPVNNFLAANIITGTARAAAFLTSQALNSIQTITDGCTYRRDQIPAITFARCQEKQPDYPIRRAEDDQGIPFLDPETVPTGDVSFTAWYRRHVRAFFDVNDASLDHLLEFHNLEHKQTPSTGQIIFDSLAADGAANYLKATKDEEGELHVEQFKARSYGKASKEALQPWILSVYSTNQLDGPPPLTEDVELLSFEQASQAVRDALYDGHSPVLLPLGFERRKVLNYRIVKASAFVFQTPEQRARILKQLQKFEERHGAGLEVLAMRRTYSGRSKGSVESILKDLYNLIRTGKTNLTQALNTGKLATVLKGQLQQRRQELERRRGEAKEEVARSMIYDITNQERVRTSLLVTIDEAENLHPIRRRFDLYLPLAVSNGPWSAMQPIVEPEDSESTQDVYAALE